MVLGLVAVACSSSAGRPAELSDCVGCFTPTVAAGGGGPTVDSGENSCGVSADDSLCNQCAGADCCPDLSACLASTDCQNLWSCETSCSGQSSCVGGCQQQYPNSVALFQALGACVTQKCTVCSELGVGDPCEPGGVACNAGLSCGGLWCTKDCARASDCLGLGAAGGNVLNEESACVRTSSSQGVCFPGCETDADCTDFPGTYCFETTSVDALSVRICATSPDAGTD
jgi:hypothetical protein